MDGIQSVLRELLDTSSWQEGQKQAELWQRWEQTVGSVLSSLIQPSHFNSESHVLWVQAKNSAALFEAKMMAEPLLRKIQLEFPELEVQGIKWRISSH